MAFYVHRSNRAERLVDVLAEVARRPQSDPFAPESIVVSSPGMERWLSMQLSQRVGVWANPEFPFPRKLIDRLLEAADPSAAQDRAGYDPTCLLFSIARELGARATDPLFAEVQRYCQHDPRGLRRLSLATRLAELFDQYFTYRPDFVLDWAAHGGAGSDRRGEETSFQPALLQALVARHGSGHLAESARRALTQLGSQPRLAAWPERVHLFGLSSLPPLYLTLLSALPDSHDVHLYVLSPSREYYADMRPKRGRRGRSRERRQLMFEDPSFVPDAHPLLVSLGRHAREFQELLEEATRYREADEDLYEDPGEDCLLHVLQSDLLSLRLRGGEGQPARHRLAADDGSLAIHACHGPMRELEVLHDQLARLIAERGVEPSEILVMTPSISDYAKVIDAVFSQPESERPVIPFRIADRGATEIEPLFLALSALFDVLESRFGANQVLDLLGFDLIRERFAIGVDQLDDLRAWLEDSGIRWGIDAAHRGEHGQPRSDDNTWRLGLSRLALGYSTGLPSDQLFAGRAPAELPSDQGELLGHFFDFCTTLFSLRELVLQPATAREWGERLTTLVREIFGERADAAERQRLGRALRDLAEHADKAGFDEAFDVMALRRLLDRTLSAQPPAGGFLSAGVTFCQLVPMRSIPFKVLCLIGLNDGVFPGNDTPLAFDLIKRQRRSGDRSRRDDDRMLFLEALLSAREHLIISYVGQSQQTGQPLPASVLVTELIEHAARSCELPGQSSELPLLARAAAMERRLVLRHPLSNSSPRYFGADPDPRLFSFAHGRYAAARAELRRGAGVQPRPFAQVSKLSTLSTMGVPERPTQLSISDLERGLMRPSREFCQRRLSLYLGDDLSVLPEREPFQLNALEKWQLASEWLEHLADDRGEASRLEVLSARGRLPHYASGRLTYAELEREVSQISGALASFTQGAPERRIDVDLRLGDVQLVGSIGDLFGAHHVRVQYSKLGRRHELRQFVRYAVLRYLSEQQPGLGLPTESILIGRKSNGDVGLVRFAIEGSSAPILSELVELYLEALGSPLALFPWASRSYAEQRHKGNEPEAALRAARGKFGDRHLAGDPESDLADVYVQQLFADFEHMHSSAAGGFERAALRLYGPLLQARREA